jgi:CPA2 family monovalent cation:H+ antiporter-2
LALLIFQDIIVVPMMLLVPIIAGESGNITESILTLLAKTAVVLVITLLSARFLLPRLLHSIALTGSRDLFLITTVTICFAVAFLTAEIGLSLALCAFLAGEGVSESEYSHQATSLILPFRELFISFFFISVGMLLDLTFFVENLGYILLILVAVFVIKSGLATLAMGILGYPTRTSLLTGLALFQVGEFAFILSKVGIDYGLISFETNQYFLSVSIVSMMLTPFVIIVSENWANRLMKWQPIRAVDERISFRAASVDRGLEQEWNNHLVILGYGINGSNLARAAQYSNIPYVAVEFDAHRVQEEKRKGVPIMYGDASQPHILERACVARARVVVLAISDRSTTRVVIHNIREISSTVQLVVRTRYVKEIPELLALGADDVIPEEYETSIEIFSRALHHFLVPEDDIEHLVDEIRENNYGVLLGKSQLPRTIRPTNFPDFRISCLSVITDDRSFVGKTIQELDIRNRYGINIVGISRDGELESNVRFDQKILQNDVLFVIGNNRCIDEFRKRIE